VILEIQDTGTGIHPDDFSKMFDPFWSTKGPSGTGLGLAVTHGIVKRHGGAISVQSEIGKGTSFVIRIPFSSQITDVESVYTKAIASQNLDILIIDDTETILLILNDLLTAHDQKVFTANSGEKGIEIFLGQHIDVIISDLGMPGMTGWEVGSAIKSICEKRGMPKTPFILLTGWGGQSLEPDKISDCGVDGVLEKPIDFSRVVQMINDLIQRHKLLCAS
jgi:CheY-like chemotaxis protein